MHFHREILTPTQQRLIERLGRLASEHGFYLAGGTAVALHFGHRRSDDFDFFTPAMILEPQAVAAKVISAGFDLGVHDMSPGTVIGEIEGVKVSFLEFAYPWLEPTLVWMETGTPIASVRDLAAMKLSAIVQRGSRRDFIDIYKMLRNGADLASMLTDYRTKFGVTETISVKRGLVYFDDAEAEPMPEMLVPVDWHELKETLIAAVRDVAGFAG
jgi:hypothetical protein